MSELRLPVAFARGVTPGKWARVWAERRPDVVLELDRVDDGAQLDALRAGTALLAFVRLPVEEDGLHLIPLYEEKPFAVAARGHLIEAAAAVTLAELEDETRHPFDDEVEMTMQIVAAGAGIVVVPQSIARLYARKDLIARPVADAPSWRIALAWLRDPAADALPEAEGLIEDFIGVVRGRTARSSRGAAAEAEAPAKAEKPKGKVSGKPGAKKSATPARRGRAPRSGGSRRRSTR